MKITQCLALVALFFAVATAPLAFSFNDNCDSTGDGIALTAGAISNSFCDAADAPAAAAGALAAMAAAATGSIGCPGCPTDYVGCEKSLKVIAPLATYTVYDIFMSPCDDGQGHFVIVRSNGGEVKVKCSKCTLAPISA
jgi:hypothetical protein